MSLSLSTSSRVCAPRRVTARSRGRQATVTKALSIQEASNWFAQSFVRIFSPNDSTVETWPAASFNGRIPDRTRKPFKDGFSGHASAPHLPSSSLEPIDHADATKLQAKAQAGYVEEAVKGVVSGLKPETEGEPKWHGATTAWRGEVHQSANKRDDRDGFHKKKF